MSDLRTQQSLVDALSKHGDRQAVMALHKEDAVRWTYQGLADYVRCLGCGLIEAGVNRGDHVALLAVNRPEWIVACLAVIEAGAVVVPLDVQLGDGELSYVLDDSSAGFILTTSDQPRGWNTLMSKPRRSSSCSTWTRTTNGAGDGC
jgi:long-chain acyl-CoA synthetase